MDREGFEEIGIWRDAVQTGIDRGAPPPAILHEFGDFLVIYARPDDWPFRGDGPLGRRASVIEDRGQASQRLRADPERALTRLNAGDEGTQWNRLSIARTPFDPQARESDDLDPRAQPAGGIEEAPSIVPARLTGKTAVAIVIVTRSGGALSAAVQDDILASVAEAAGFLAKAAPNLDATFAYSLDQVQVDVAAGPMTAAHEASEAPWRDAALAALGIASGGDAGTLALARAAANSTQADAGFVLFLTTYDLRSYAYALRQGGRLLIDLNQLRYNDWKFARTIAHEMGHIFGAPDEYAPCSCGETRGPYGVTNGNCENCGGGMTLCIMRNVSWNMCAATPYHLGYTGLPAPPPHLTAQAATA